MTRSFKLPNLGEGIHEGEVLAVLVLAGQEVNEGDIILEVETDKAAVEIPSPYTGIVNEIFVKPGDVVKVGDVMMTFSDGEQAAAEEDAEKAIESREKELKEEFILMLGPMGIAEFDELKNKNAIEKSSLIDYIDELKELNILSDLIADEFKTSIGKIFGENITDEEFEKEVLKVE